MNEEVMVPMSIESLEKQRKFHQGRVTYHEDRVRSVEETMAAAVCPYRKGQRVMVQKSVWIGMAEEAEIVEEWFIDYIEYQSWHKPPYSMYGRKIKKNGEPTNFRAREIRGEVLRVVE